jgi:predicted metalloprotease with PDZ domain
MGRSGLSRREKSSALGSPGRAGLHLDAGFSVVYNPVLMKANGMVLVILGLFLAASVACGAEPEPSVFCQVSFPNPVHHEARFSITFSAVPAGEPLVIRMSRSSPGYYALFAFSKNLYNEKAVDSRGRELPVTRPDQHQWIVGLHDGTVTFGYTLFADCLDGTHSSVSENRILLNMPASCAWAEGFEKAPVTVKITKPHAAWKTVTQLKAAGSAGDLFTAPDLAALMDSPVAIAPFTEVRRNFGLPGARREFRLALDHRGTAGEAEKFCDDLVKALEAEREVFGEYPAFGDDVYTLIAFLTPAASFDGMEHRDSAVLTSRDQLKDAYAENLRLAAHEIFHAWHGERLRPASLEPFDLTRENMSAELWFMEGAAVYYEGMALLRNGTCPMGDFTGILTASANYTYTYPGPSLYSLADMSRKAVLFNGGVYADPDNRDNYYVSYYPQGCIAVLALDLSLRSRFQGLSLDVYMKSLWDRYGRTAAPYTNGDLQESLAVLTGDRAFAGEFFTRYVYGKELPDIAPLLREAGFLLRKRFPERASPGRDWIIDYDAGTALVDHQTLSNEPYYRAGIDRGDVILKIGSRSVKSRKEFLAAFDPYKPGQAVTATILKPEGNTVTARITLEAEKTLEIVPFEQAGLPLSGDMAAFRKKWLGPQTAGDNP